MYLREICRSSGALNMTSWEGGKSLYHKYLSCAKILLIVVRTVVYKKSFLIQYLMYTLDILVGGGSGGSALVLNFLAFISLSYTSYINSLYSQGHLRGYFFPRTHCPELVILTSFYWRRSRKDKYKTLLLNAEFQTIHLPFQCTTATASIYRPIWWVFISEISSTEFTGTHSQANDYIHYLPPFPDNFIFKS